LFPKEGVELLEAGAVDEENCIMSLLFSLCTMDIRGVLKEND